MQIIINAQLKEKVTLVLEVQERQMKKPAVLMCDGKTIYEAIRDTFQANSWS